MGEDDHDAAVQGAVVPLCQLLQLSNHVLRGEQHTEGFSNPSTATGHHWALPCWSVTAPAALCSAGSPPRPSAGSKSHQRGVNISTLLPYLTSVALSTKNKTRAQEWLIISPRGASWAFQRAATVGYVLSPPIPCVSET